MAGTLASLPQLKTCKVLRCRHRTLGENFIDVRRAFDNRWTLTALYLAYAAVDFSTQHEVWLHLTSDRLVGPTAAAGLILPALAAVPLAAYLAPATSERLASSLSSWFAARRGSAMYALIALAVIAPACVAWGILQRFQNSGDEFAYFFQAQLFSTGHWWAQAPPLGDAFVPYRTWVIGDKWVSQYPPGWPLALAAVMAVGIPSWCLNSLLGGASAAVLMSQRWKFENTAMRFAMTALYVSTPFYLLNAASFYSHLLPALATLLLCVACLGYHDRPNTALASAGALMGLIGLTRYFSLILLFPALAYWLIVDLRGHRLRATVIMGLAGLPFLALLMIYQYRITGNPLHNTYSLIANDDTFVSFAPADVALGIKLTLYRFVELSIWVSPLILPAYAYCLAHKMRTRSIAFYDWIFPSFIVGFLFFADLGGNRYGPRYYFEAFPLMLATIMSAAPVMVSSTGRRLARPLALHALAISVAYVVIAVPIASVAYRRQVDAREEPYRLVAARHLDRAIVIIEASSGPGLDAQDLARNDASLRAPVLYARQGASLHELRRLFPERGIWSYVRQDGRRSGRLVFHAPTDTAEAR